MFREMDLVSFITINRFKSVNHVNRVKEQNILVMNRREIDLEVPEIVEFEEM